MAYQQTLVPDCTPTGTAAADLSAHQFKFVQLLGNGVNLADVRSAPYTGNYILQTGRAGSGFNVALMGAPSIGRVIAGEAILVGQCVQPMSASGLAGVTSGGNAACVGVAWTAATGSGDMFSVKMGR